MDTPQFPPLPDAPVPSAPGAAPTGQAVDAVKLPAIFLIIFGALDVAVSLFALIQNLIGASQPEVQEMLNRQGGGPEAERIIQFATKATLGLSVLWVIAGAIVIFGAVQMMRLRSFGLALAAAIIAVIPCFGSYPCCLVLGIPLGVWALVVLNKPEVKGSFS